MVNMTKPRRASMEVMRGAPRRRWRRGDFSSRGCGSGQGFGRHDGFILELSCGGYLKECRRKNGQADEWIFGFMDGRISAMRGEHRTSNIERRTLNERQGNRVLRSPSLPLPRLRPYCQRPL